jgi:hypothetical protein
MKLAAFIITQAFWIIKLNRMGGRHTVAFLDCRFWNDIIDIPRPRVPSEWRKAVKPAPS